MSPHKNTSLTFSFLIQIIVFKELYGRVFYIYFHSKYGNILYLQIKNKHEKGKMIQ